MEFFKVFAATDILHCENGIINSIGIGRVYTIYMINTKVIVKMSLNSECRS